MIHIVTCDNRKAFHHDLVQMHRQRKTLFVDQLGWSLECPEGMEIDEFDGSDAVYLLDLDGESGLQASVRLLPTTMPHVLGAVFPDLCSEPVPVGKWIWEASRFCPNPSIACAAERRAKLALLIAGMTETGLLFGVEQLTFVSTIALRITASAIGWRIRSLGPRRKQPDGPIGAFIADLDAATLREIRARHNLVAPLCRFEAPQRIAA